MVSTLAPGDVEVGGYAVVVNASFNSTMRGGSSVYMAHNSTLRGGELDAPFHMSSSLSLQFIGFMVLVSVCSVMGTLGNVPVLLVYCTKSEQRTTNTFIKVLAVIDLVVCAVIMPYSIIMELHLITSDILCRVFEFVRHVSIGASNLTLVAIAIERYMAVCVISHRLTVHNVNQGMFMVIAVSVFIAIPSMGMFAVVTTDQVQNVNCTFIHNFEPGFSFCHFTTSLLGPGLSTAYQATLMTFFFITFIVIVILYSIVYGSLWKRAKRRTFMQSFAIDAEITSSNEKKRSREVSLQEIDQDTEHQKEEEKLELQVNDKLIIYPANEISECSIPEQTVPVDGESGKFNSRVGLPATSVPSRIRRVARHRLLMHRRTARMLFLCSVIFLVTWMPFWVDVFNHTHNVCLRYLFFVGNASNPLVYGIANSQFRKSLVKLLVSLRPHCGSSCRHT